MRRCILPGRSSVSACFVLALATLVSAAAKDPFVGTWKLNVAKSKFDGGVPPKSSTATITTVGNKRRVAVHTVPANGPELNTESTAADDGKDYPLQGSATVDSVAVTRIDARTVERKDKKAGRLVATLRARVATDGKTMTINQKGTTLQGQPYSNTLVYDRQ
jgi:hypothetical protein